MAQQTMHGQTGSETGEPEELIQAGAVTFGLEYRTLSPAPNKAFVFTFTTTLWRDKAKSC